MSELSQDEMARFRGGQDCDATEKVAMVSCAATSVSGPIGALIFGPTCLGTAIGYAASC